MGNDPVNAVDPTGMATSLVVNTFKIGRAGYKHRSISGAVRGIGREIAYDWNQLGSGSTATAGQQLGSAADLIFGSAFNESADGETKGDYPANPDDWTPPDGVEETNTGEKTEGKHRQWKDSEGKIVRRWDREGREGGKERGSHWHDSERPDEHIEPDKFE